MSEEGIGRRTILRGMVSMLIAGGLPMPVKSEISSTDKRMLAMLPEAKKHAHPPISNFFVGAVGLGASGAMYLGANLEFPGNPLNQSVHGEQAVVVNAFSKGEKKLVALAVTDAPCGHCRQFLNEMTGASTLRIVVEGHPPRTLADLLPSAFGPADLGNKSGMLDSAPTPMRFASDGHDDVSRAALQAASRAYAPYSKSPSGCAVAMKSGHVYAGSYLENAAFNPSLSPLQVALVNAILAGEDVATIQGVVLVELKGATISQQATTKAGLDGIAPHARLEVLPAIKS
jgi:cytidine deaminase